MKQPDTSTMEGRHAVELASRTKRIQFQKFSTGWMSLNTPLKFNWVDCNYRIHPDDLIEPGNGYRLLAKGETIQECDEVWCKPIPGWLATNDSCGNCKAGDNGLTYRRKIEQPKWYCGVCGAEAPCEPISGDDLHIWCDECNKLMVHAAMKYTQPKPPTYRPWKQADVMAGTVLHLKENPEETILVTYVTPNYIYLNRVKWSYPDLLNSDWRLNGEPCGVKEE